MRRYTPLKPSRGTVIPAEVRVAVHLRDQGCVGRLLGWPHDHTSALELDHVRASGGMGMKSPSTADNLVALCGECHRWKTEHGRTARVELVDYLERIAS